MDSIILQLCALNVKNIHKFEFIDKPSVDNIKKSINTLESLDGIRKLNDNEYEVIIFLFIYLNQLFFNYY